MSQIKAPLQKLGIRLLGSQRDTVELQKSTVKRCAASRFDADNVQVLSAPYPSQNIFNPENKQLHLPSRGWQNGQDQMCSAKPAKGMDYSSVSAFQSISKFNADNCRNQTEMDRFLASLPQIRTLAKSA